MQALLFYIFAGLTLLCALLVVANPFSRNPVTSAMFLVLAIASLAGLFVLLHAFFLAAVQVLIYAGAVMVLFLFVIMMIDVREAVLQRFLPGSNLPALVLLVLLGIEMLVLVLRSDRFSVAEPVAMRTGGEVRQLSTTLFADYLLPFEVASVILLAALVGAIVLARKEPQ